MLVFVELDKKGFFFFVSFRNHVSINFLSSTASLM